MKREAIILYLDKQSFLSSIVVHYMEYEDLLSMRDPTKGKNKTSGCKGLRGYLALILEGPKSPYSKIPLRIRTIEKGYYTRTYSDMDTENPIHVELLLKNIVVRDI